MKATFNNLVAFVLVLTLLGQYACCIGMNGNSGSSAKHSCCASAKSASAPASTDSTHPASRPDKHSSDSCPMLDGSHVVIVDHVPSPMLKVDFVLPIAWIVDTQTALPGAFLESFVVRFLPPDPPDLVHLHVQLSC